METNTVVVAVIAIVIFVLALVTIFRFDKVKNTFEGLGFKVGISGSRENKKRDAKDVGEPVPTSKSSIKIGGKVSDSDVLSKGANESEVDIKKDVERSNVRSEAGGKNKR